MPALRFRRPSFLPTSARSFGTATTTAASSATAASQHRMRTEAEFNQQSSAFHQLQSTSDRVARIVNPYMRHMNISREQDSILEIACGPGIIARQCVQYGPKSYAGLDISERMLEIAESEVRAEVDLEQASGSKKTSFDAYSFTKGTAESLPFEDNSFSLVISRLAFHHFYDVRPVLAEIRRVLKPQGEGGRFVLCDMCSPSDDPMSAANQLMDSIEILRDNSHVRTYGQNEMLDLFEECGFAGGRVVEVVQDERTFQGWLEQTGNQVTNAKLVANRTEYPLQAIVKQLLEFGSDCGISLKKNENGELMFTHRYCIWQTQKAE